MKTIFASALLLIFFYPAFGQKKGQSLVDSLRAELPKAKEDSNKVKILLAISDGFENLGNNDTSLIYAGKALALANKIRYEKGVGSAFGDIAICYNNQGNYQASIKNYQDGLSVFQKIGNKRGMGRCLNGIGLDYIGISDYPKALEYLLKSLTIFQQMGFKRGVGVCFNNIGNVYKWQKNNTKALEYYLKANSIFEEMDFKRGLANSQMNIGNCYNVEGNHTKTLEYYFKSLSIFREIEDKEGTSFVLGNISDVYLEMHDYPKALEYGFKSLALNKETGDMPEYGSALSRVGAIYINQKKYAQSKIYLDSGLHVTKRTGEKEEIEDVYENLAQLDSARGDYKNGWEYYKNYILYHDSLINEATIKKTTQAEMNYDFGRKTDSTKAEQDKLASVAAQESQRQKIIRNSFIGGFSITFLASGLFFYQRRKISKEKKRSDELLLNILPSETAEELKATGSAKAKSYDMVTVLFTDFKNFTQASEKLNAEQLVEEIHHCYSEFDRIITRYGIEKIKTIGDSYMCAGGLPIENKTNPVDSISAALEIQKFMHDLKASKEKEGMNYFEIRIGIHTGPVVAGIVGIKKFAYDIWGDTVNIASRMESSGEAGRVNISESTYQLVKDKFRCAHRGKIDAKNKGMIDMYFVEGEIT